MMYIYMYIMYAMYITSYVVVVTLHTRMIYSQAVIIVQIWYKHGITMGWDLANFV